MAITITDKPYSVTRVGQPLIIAASSTNTGNAGFRYVVRLTYFDGTTDDFYITPNPSGRLMFNMMESLKNKGNVNITNGIYSISERDSSQNVNGFFSYQITIFEAWEVDGLLTINEASQIDVQAEEDETDFYYLLSSYSPRDGYRPDPSLTYGFAAGATSNTSTRLLMGDRDSNTHPLPEGLPFITFAPANYVAQPVRNSDWGVVSFLTGYSTSSVPLGVNLWVRYLLVKENLTAETYSEQINDEVRLTSLPAYPANLNQGIVGTIVPANFPDYKYYTIQLFNQDPSNPVGLQAMSALYIFYPVPDDCQHDNVRLCWWSPNKGGYDFFNFTKVNEESVSVERKRISKVVGNYAGTSFSLDNTKGGLTELSVKPTTTIEISSDWISEGEFKLISNIVKSKAVWIINDDRSATPVVVETNSFLSERKRDGKLKRATLRLQMANENYYY